MRGVALEDFTAGEEFSILFLGIDSFITPTGGVTEGDEIYIDMSNSELTTTESGNQPIGKSLSTSSAGDDFELFVNPSAGEVTEGDGGGGSPLTVEEEDGAPSVSNVTTIIFDQADGFTVTDNGGGSVTIGFDGSVAMPQATKTTLLMNSISTTNVTITFSTTTVAVEVINDSAINLVACRFDGSDAAIPTNSATPTANNLVRPREARYFPVAVDEMDIIASASSTGVRVTAYHE